MNVIPRVRHNNLILEVCFRKFALAIIDDSCNSTLEEGHRIAFSPVYLLFRLAFGSYVIVVVLGVFFPIVNVGAEHLKCLANLYAVALNVFGDDALIVLQVRIRPIDANTYISLARYIDEVKSAKIILLSYNILSNDTISVKPRRQVIFSAVKL